MTDPHTDTQLPSIYDTMISVEFNEFKTSVNNQLDQLNRRIDTLHKLYSSTINTNNTTNELNGQIDLKSNKHDIYMELIDAQQLQIDKLVSILNTIQPAASHVLSHKTNKQLNDSIQQSSIKPVTKYISAEGTGPIRRTNTTDAIDSVVVLFAIGAVLAILAVVVNALILK